MMRNILVVVVTHNRLDLLTSCIQAINNQSLQPDLIVLVDNASEIDNSPAFATSRIPVIYEKLRDNVGGAGGFNRGLQIAKRMVPDFIWVMDDDTIPTENALRELVFAYDNLAPHPALVASKVVWKDGTLHPMNLPHLDLRDHDLLLDLCHTNVLPIRSASFVSILLPYKTVCVNEMPIKEYFIWNDDLEYTGRAMKETYGVLSINSVVLHDTKSKYSPVESSKERFYFEARNKASMIMYSDAWSGKERLMFTLNLLNSFRKYVKISHDKPDALKVILKGTFDAVFRRMSH